MKGLVDIDQEIAKISKKLEAVKLSQDKLQKTVSQANYEDVIPENVREANAEKVNDRVKVGCGGHCLIFHGRCAP